MNNLCEASQHREFHLSFLEPMRHIRIISDFCPRNHILVCEEPGVNTLQKGLFSQKIVTVVIVVMKVEGILVIAHYYLWGILIDRIFCGHDVTI